MVWRMSHRHRFDQALVSHRSVTRRSFLQNLNDHRWVYSMLEVYSLWKLLMDHWIEGTRAHRLSLHWHRNSEKIKKVLINAVWGVVRKACHVQPTPWNVTYFLMILHISTPCRATMCTSLALPLQFSVWDLLCHRNSSSALQLNYRGWGKSVSTGLWACSSEWSLSFLRNLRFFATKWNFSWSTFLLFDECRCWRCRDWSTSWERIHRLWVRRSTFPVSLLQLWLHTDRDAMWCQWDSCKYLPSTLISSERRH